jgi:hypothetical protein
MPETNAYMIRLTGTEQDEDMLFTLIRSKGKAVNPISRTVRNGVCKAQYGPFDQAFAESCRETVMKYQGISSKCLIEVFAGRFSSSRPTV